MKSAKTLIWILLLTLMLSLASAALDDAVLYFTLNDADNTGNNVHDVSLTGNNGTNVSTDSTPGIIGEAFEFDFAAGGYIQTGNTGFTSATGTVNFWVKIDTQNDNDGWFAYNSETADDEIIVLQGGGGSSGQIRVMTDGANRLFYGTTTEFKDAWGMFTLVQNTTSVSIFINGTHVATGDNTIWFDNFQSKTVMVGREQRNAQTIRGSIDEFGIWERNLSQAEITTLFNSGAALNPYDVGDTTPPTNSSWNYTNKNIFGSENNQTWNTNDGLINVTNNSASFTFLANEDSNWSCSPYDINFTYMVTLYPSSPLATLDTTSHAVTDYPFNLTLGTQCIFCSGIDNSGNEYVNSSSGCLNINFSDEAPIVQLNSTADNSDWWRYEYKTSGFLFNFTASDNIGLYSCELYGNWSGAWLKNQTNTSRVINNTAYNWTPINLTIGHYKWNVNCNDTYNQSVWAVSNFTLRVNNSIPEMSDFNVTVNESMFYSSINLDGFVTDLDGDENITYTVAYEDTTEMDCTITGNILTYNQGPLYPTGNFSCLVEINDSRSWRNYSFGADIVPHNITLALSSGISDWDFVPSNATHPALQPQDQLSSRGVFNVTNNEAYNLTIQFFTTIWHYFVKERLVEDFNDLTHYKFKNETSLNQTVAYNYTLTCAAFQPSRTNWTQGRYSGRIKYTFRNSVEREFHNSTGQWQKINVTFKCPKNATYIYWNFTTNFTGFNETYNTDWRGFNKLNISYLGDGSHNGFRINLTNSTGSLYSSGNYTLRTNTSWTNISVDITGLNNISEILFEILFNQSVNTINDTGMFYIDDLFIYNETVISGNSFKILDSYNYTNAIALSSSYVNVTQNLTTLTSKGYWLWQDYVSLNTSLYYDFYARGILNGS